MYYYYKLKLFFLLYFVFVYFFVSVVFFFHFIHFGALGIITMILTKHYYNIFSAKKLRWFLAILGGTYGATVLRIFDILLMCSGWVIKNWIKNWTQQAFIQCVKGSIFGIFSMQYLGGDTAIPGLPPLYKTIIAFCSGSILCLLVLQIFRKEIQKTS